MGKVIGKHEGEISYEVADRLIGEMLTEFEAAGPEVLARFRRQFGWCAESGCQFLAVVFVGSFKRYLADNIFKGLPFRAVRYFEQEAAAIQWLGEQLNTAPCEPASA